MQKPKVATLSSEEREELIQHIKASSLTGDEQQAIIELVKFCNELIDKLGSVDKNFNVTILKFQRNLEKLKKWLELYQI